MIPGNLFPLKFCSTTKWSLKLVSWTLIPAKDHVEHLIKAVYWDRLEIGHVHSLHCLALQRILTASGFPCTSQTRPGKQKYLAVDEIFTRLAVMGSGWWLSRELPIPAYGYPQTFSVIKSLRVSGSSRYKQSPTYPPENKVTTPQCQISQCNYSSSIHLSLLLNWAIYPPCKRH